MSCYWCADDANGKAIKDGYSGDWPLKVGAAAKAYPPEDYYEEDAHFLLAIDIYTALAKLRPDGGEIPWDDVPEWIKEASDFPDTPAKVCVSF